jgi:SAM-dependent methyltransferase
MAIDINSAQLLVGAWKAGVKFENSITLGRLHLNVFPARMVKLLEQHGANAEIFKAAKPECAFAEALFRSLGAKKVSMLDNSDYEGASIVHDLNQPIRPEWREQFDAVYDGGTLEHVFQFPTALRNCMELCREGGRVFIHTVANNLCGHGFYQFSPELFYRAFSAENGFEVERMIIHRVGPYGAWRQVSDPQKIRERVELITFTPVQMMIQARRVAIKPIFAQAPQQSDYTVLWNTTEQAANVAEMATTAKNPMFPALARVFNAIKYGTEFYRRQSLGNRRFFRKVPRELD